MSLRLRWQLIEMGNPTKLHKEEGSAASEFVLIAIPLFLPAILFFLSMHNSAMVREGGSMIARTAASAFVEAGDDSSGYLRVAALVDEYEALNQGTSKEPQNFSFHIQCSHQPCIEPREWVEVSIYRDTGNDRILIGRSKSYVGRWTG